MTLLVSALFFNDLNGRLLDLLGLVKDDLPHKKSAKSKTISSFHHINDQIMVISVFTGNT